MSSALSSTNPVAGYTPSASNGGKLGEVAELSGRARANFTSSGVKINALVDSGSSLTLLRLDIFHKLCERTKRSSLLQPVTVIARSVTGQRLYTVGATQILIDGARPVRVTIVKDLPHQMILGSYDLTKGHGVIDLGSNTLTWWSKKWSLTRCTPADVGVSSILYTDIDSGSDFFTNVVMGNQDVFSSGKEPIGQCSVVKMKVETEGRPLKQKAYRIPLRKRKLVEEAVADMLEDGII